MTPRDALLHAADQINRAYPHLRTTNTYGSCGEFVQRLCALDPAFSHVGKTGGDQGFVPVSGFGPVILQLTDPEGALRMVTIDHLSHDAVWHPESHQQFKVLSSSAANSDPDPAKHGVANVSCYLIDAANYRWNNPPMPGVAPVPPNNFTSAPLPPPSPILKPREQFYGEFQAVNAFYAADDGLQRVGGMVAGVDASVFNVLRRIASGEITDAATIQHACAAVLLLKCDDQAMAAWCYDLLAGNTVEACRAEIRHSGEWQAKHPGETP